MKPLTIAFVALVTVAVLTLADSSRVREAQAQLPLGDIVFIVDESGSMGPDIADVRNNVNNIANQLGASVDFQLGLVGFGDGTHFGAPFGGAAHIHQALTSDVPTFQNAVNQLVASGNFEPGFSATVLGMSDPMGFRQGAGVCSIIITDEDADISLSAPETKADALAALNSRGAVFLGIVDPNSGNTTADYGPNVGSLAEATGGQVFDIIAFRADPQPVLDSIIADCIESLLSRLEPRTAENSVGTDHTVTATFEQGTPPVAVPDVLVTFEVVAGPNAGEISDPGTGECTVNDSCTTDASGQVSWTYTGSGGIGSDRIRACFVEQDGTERCAGATKEWIEPPFIEVPVDIKPTSCRNPLNVGSRGVLPAAILGTADFDVTQVDPASVLLEGVVSPLRWAMADVATPFEPFTGKADAFDCTEEGPDGFLDLTLQFDKREVVAALGAVEDGDVVVLHLTGNLLDGTPIVGEDVVVILE